MGNGCLHPLAKGLLACLLAATLFITGCATTPEPALDVADTAGLPDSDVALLHASFEIDLLTINGTPAPRPAVFSRATSRTLRLLPGHQEVVARYNSPFDDQFAGSKSTPVLIAFIAEAGRSYRVDFSRDGAGRDVRIWIRDDHGTPVPAAPPTGKQPPTKNTDGFSGGPLENLKQAWRDAGAEDRDAFRAWIQAQ